MGLCWPWCWRGAILCVVAVRAVRIGQIRQIRQSAIRLTDFKVTFAKVPELRFPLSFFPPPSPPYPPLPLSSPLSPLLSLPPTPLSCLF